MIRLHTSLLLAASLSLPTLAWAQTAPPPAAPPTIKASSRIVVIDVGVTDAQGNPIKDLKAADFSLKDSGTPQTISQFEAHAALPPGQAAKLPPLPKMDSNMFTNFSPVPDSGALNVLLLDALNTPMKDQAYVRSEMLKYLKTPHPGVRMAIFGLNSKLVLLQGFTSDPETLRKAIASGKNGPKASIAMDNPASGDNPGGDSLMDSMISDLGNDPSMTTLIANLTQFDAEIKSYQTQTRIQYTLDAMNNLARYLSGLPGRKNLIWFSGSFPLNIMPDGDLVNPFAIMADYSQEYHETATLLQKSQVAVYPIDARGLMTSPMYSAANSGANMTVQNPKAMMKDQQTFLNNTVTEHGTMQQMADDTGGKAFVNTNDLTGAVEKAIDTGANYYTLVYAPTNKDWKGDFHKVQVQLAKSGYTLTYRHGYFADDDTPKKKDGPQDAPLQIGGGRGGGGGGGGRGGGGGMGGGMQAPNPMDPRRAAMRAAMQFGGPDPTQILFKAAINPATGQPEKEIVKGNMADPKMSGPYERYVIYLAALPSDFAITPTEAGKHRLGVEMITLVYNSNGEVLNSATVRAAGDIDDAKYKAMQEQGLQFRQEISVPVKGLSFVRVGLRDLVTDRVGAIEVPVSALVKLKPLATPAATAKP